MGNCKPSIRKARKRIDLIIRFISTLKIRKLSIKSINEIQEIIRTRVLTEILISVFISNLTKSCAFLKYNTNAIPLTNISDAIKIIKFELITETIIAKIYIPFSIKLN